MRAIRLSTATRRKGAASAGGVQSQENGAAEQDREARLRIGISRSEQPTSRRPTNLAAPCGHFFRAPGRLAVPRYYFTWNIGTHCICDDAGVELPDDNAARQRAEAERELLMATFLVEHLHKDCCVEVCDTQVQMLFRIPASSQQEAEQASSANPA